jgi:hypothetical protein
VGLVPCGHVRWFFGCGLVQLSTLFLSIPQADHSDSATAMSAGMGGRLGADLALPGRLKLRFSADLLALVPRVKPKVDNEMVWASPPVVGALGVGLVSPLF